VNRIRIAFLAAAALTALAVLLPLWGFRMSAPQYPGESLHLRVSRLGIRGDVGEITNLQKYVGVRFPETIPELRWLLPAAAVLALLLAAGGLAGEATAGRVLRVVARTALVLFLLASAALLQRRLWEVGHRRDPRAPLQSVRNFTPPAIGPVRVGNFTVWSYPHAGGLAFAVAAGLVLFASRRSATRSLRART
jgi:hypothetical protein